MSFLTVREKGAQKTSLHERRVWGVGGALQTENRPEPAGGDPGWEERKRESYESVLQLRRIVEAKSYWKPKATIRS